METGLGNQAMLAKIDKLRELNVGSMIPLPQLVVVGDQSSGKSSVLESLTGFSFPRAAGLCTRYATQITCCRDPVKSVVVSIIPRPDADDELKASLHGFHRRIDELHNDELANIFHEANLAMGIRMTEAVDFGCGAFSQDILKIEIHGPEQSHLTVIDVPGIFRVATPGLTTETDITLVENMVKSYMSNRRTIILAVMPCNVDIATQEILKLAEVADPDGVRTMGVLTKPDLATETATRNAVLDLVLGKRSNLKLGYYVVKNRSADDSTSTLAQRAAAEASFFMDPAWEMIRDRCGISALKERLGHLLMSISKQEFPHVKAEIEQRLRRCKADLATMGPSRADQSSQRLYLGKLATQFQTVTRAALNGYYAGNSIFETQPGLKIITKMMKLNEVFSNVLVSCGHSQQFDSESGDEGESQCSEKPAKVPFEVPLRKYCELHHIISTDNYDCSEPSDSPAIDLIREVFESSRGPDLGTFGGTVLSTVFEQQSKKWEPLALSHASNAIALVHDYIFQLLISLCPEKQVRDQLWDGLLMEKLSERYTQAMDHTRFLLSIERGGRPSTFNHSFYAKVQEKRTGHVSTPLKEKAIAIEGLPDTYVQVTEIEKWIEKKGGREQVCEDILDTLVSYYAVASKRFVDVVCQQVISHFLLDSDVSPLGVFSPDLIMGLDPDLLEMVAGEDEESKQQRQTLGRDMKSLEAALKVLRV